AETVQPPRVAGPRRRGAATSSRAGRPRTVPSLRPVRGRPGGATDHPQRPGRRTLRRGVRPAQGAARAPRPRAEPRRTRRAAQGLRARALRPHGRRSRYPATAQDRAGPRPPHLPSHRLGRGLPVLAGQRARSRMMVPRTLFGRTALVIALVSFAFQAFTIAVITGFALMPLGRHATSDLAALMIET